MSHDASLQDKMLHPSVRISAGTRHEFWNELTTSTEVPLYYEKLEMELLYDPVFLLLEIYPRKSKTLIQKNICTLMFIAVLFMIAKFGSRPSVHW